MVTSSQVDLKSDSKSISKLWSLWFRVGSHVHGCCKPPTVSFLSNRLCKLYFSMWFLSGFFFNTVRKTFLHWIFFCPDSNWVKITFLTHIPYSYNCVLFQIEQRICIFAPFLLNQWHQSILSKFQFFLYPLRRASNVDRLTIVCNN